MILATRGGQYNIDDDDDDERQHSQRRCRVDQHRCTLDCHTITSVDVGRDHPALVADERRVEERSLELAVVVSSEKQLWAISPQRHGEDVRAEHARIDERREVLRQRS